MNILSIGILAHNEAAVISRTLTSLARQSIFDQTRAAALGVEAVELIVVPNGCTDETVTITQQAISQLSSFATATVRALDKPGKADAWNRFVHEFARFDATLLTLMDADIEFGTDDVLERLVVRLADDPAYDVATDRPVKDYRGKRLTSFDRLSRRVSQQQVADGGLCGQLYCGRAAVLRRIWLPAGLPVEDGFVSAMLGSNGFTLPAGREAIAYAPGAWHYYEPVTGPTAFVRHEARIIVGSVINAWLFALMWEAGRSGHAGDYVRRRNAEDPRWVETVCEEAKQGLGRWIVPDAFVWWRLKWLRGQPLRRWLVRAPIAIAATLASLPAVWRANTILRRAEASRHW